MPAKKGTGLLMVWCDVPEDREDEFNRWYNEEHIAEILTVPGVLNAARYEAVKGGPKHLAAYELDSPAAVLGDGFTKRTKSKWSETMGPTLIGKNFFNPLYEMIYPDSVSGEMERSGMKSFCCGAGGGRMWMEETIGTSVAGDRAKEAIDTGAKTIATACPFCMTMLTDGVKGLGKGDDVAVRDIAEIVADSLDD